MEHAFTSKQLCHGLKKVLASTSHITSHTHITHTGSTSTTPSTNTIQTKCISLSLSLIRCDMCGALRGGTLPLSMAMERSQKAGAEDLRHMFQKARATGQPGAPKGGGARSSIGSRGMVLSATREVADVKGDCEPAAVLQPIAWVCGACTLENNQDAASCVVCGALRGGSLPAAVTLAQQGTHGRGKKVSHTKGQRGIAGFLTSAQASCTSAHSK